MAIEQATLRDMRFFLNSAKDEGWNPGLFDDIPFYYTDASGFFIERIDSKPIGCISAVAYDASYGFMGFYIILPQYRGQGFGIQLWNHAIAYLGERSMGLDGVVQQQNNYRKSGFEFYWNNIRFKGRLKGKISKELQKIDALPFPMLVDYDARVCGIRRAAFLQHWINMPNAVGFVKLEGNSLLGYGIIRKCEIGYKIGPLFADSFSVAKEIFLSLSAHCGEADIFLDVVQANSEAMGLVKEHRFEKVFDTARMYKGTPPLQKLEKVFGVTTFELG